jgi:hypothetical protein
MKDWMKLPQIIYHIYLQGLKDPSTLKVQPLSTTTTITEKESTATKSSFTSVPNPPAGSPDSEARQDNVQEGNSNMYQLLNQMMQEKNHGL